MQSKNFDNKIIQEFIFFPLILENWSAITPKNDHSKIDDLLQCLIEGKDKLKALGKPGENLLSIIEFYTENNSVAIPQTLQAMQLELSEAQKSACLESLKKIEDIFFRQVKGDDAEYKKVIIATSQNVIQKTYDIFLLYLVEYSTLANHLAKRIDLWKKNLTEEKLNNYPHCIEQINAIQEKLSNAPRFTEEEDKTIQKLFTLLESTKKILSIIYHFKTINLSLENSKNGFFSLPKDVLVAVMSRLSVHEVMKFRPLCRLSRNSFEQIKAETFKMLMERDFPLRYKEVTADLLMQYDGYFNFYKKTFCEQACFLILQFGTTIAYISYEAVFNENFLTTFEKRLSDSKGLYNTLKELAFSLQGRHLRPNQYYGYFLINLSLATAQQYMESKQYEKVLSKVSFFNGSFYAVSHNAPKAAQKKIEVAYDSKLKKFQNLSEITLDVHDRFNEKRPDSATPKNCFLM